MRSTTWLLLAPPHRRPPANKHHHLDATEHDASRVPVAVARHVTQRDIDLMALVREVRLVGVLDRSVTAVVIRHCVAGTQPLVVVDLSELTFLDPDGYRALAAARYELHKRGRTLRLVGAVDQPARFIEAIESLRHAPEATTSSPAHRDSDRAGTVSRRRHPPRCRRRSSR